MALLQKVTQQQPAAEESYKNLVKIKELYYGEFAETLVIALKNLGAVQLNMGKNEEANETLSKAVETGKKIVDAGKVKDKNVFKNHITEIVFLLMSDQSKGTQFDEEKFTVYENLLRNLIGGEKDSKFAYFLFLKAKRMMMCSNTIPEETLAAIEKAISIQADLEKNSTKKSAQLGRFYYM